MQRDRYSRYRGRDAVDTERDALEKYRVKEIQ